jgi:hypothetical protein
VCVLSLYICIVKECALRVLFFVSSANSCRWGDIRLIFFVWLALFRSHEWIQTPLPREREETSPLSCGPKCTIDFPARQKKKKSDLIVDQKKSFLLDITKKRKKGCAVCVPCGTYISSEKEKRDDARIFVFFRIALSLSIFFRYVCGARLVCEWFFFLREALKMWVLLIILTTRAPARIFRSLSSPSFLVPGFTRVDFTFRFIVRPGVAVFVGASAVGGHVV